MKNLHLQPMNSLFDDQIVCELNKIFPHEENLFVQKYERQALKNLDNCITDPLRFTPEYINECCSEYKHIVLHSLFLSSDEILRLTDEAASKIIWCVWGHDLYTVPKKKHYTFKKFVHEAIHFAKMVVRGTHIKIFRKTKRVRDKVGKFHCIAIGYPYDEKMIRKKYGNNVPVKYGPYFSELSDNIVADMRKKHLEKNDKTTNILIGHCGFEFLEHEKYLKKLSKYADEDIHINLVLSYGASEERILRITELANALFGSEKCTILTKNMPQNEYFYFLSKMDIAIFPFKHQSALGNTKSMAYAGTKLFFHPRGVLAKGFKLGEVKTYDCRKVGRISFEKLCKNDAIADTEAPLFNTFNYEKNTVAWRCLIE